MKENPCIFSESDYNVHQDSCIGSFGRADNPGFTDSVMNRNGEGRLDGRLGRKNETAANLRNVLTSFLSGQASDPIASETQKALKDRDSAQC